YPPAFMGGYELGCAQMVDALRGEGHEVCVVTSHSAVPVSEAHVHRVLTLAPVYNADLLAAAPADLQRHFHLQSAIVTPANVANLAAVIEDFSPDVAYLWNLTGIGGMGVLAQFAHHGIPWVWHLMDQIPRQLCRFGTTGPDVGSAFGDVFPGRYIACSSH